MIRALVSIKAANIEEARAIAQAPPFNVPAEIAANLFVPANEVRNAEGTVILIPATIFWASGEFDDVHFAAMASQAAGLDWASVDSYDLLNDPGFPARRLAELEAMSTFSVRGL
jgi:hypothetical protein